MPEDEASVAVEAAPPPPRTMAMEPPAAEPPVAPPAAAPAPAPAPAPTPAPGGSGGSGGFDAFAAKKSAVDTPAPEPVAAGGGFDAFGARPPRTDPGSSGEFTAFDAGPARTGAGVRTLGEDDVPGFDAFGGRPAETEAPGGLDPFGNVRQDFDETGTTPRAADNAATGGFDPFGSSRDDLSSSGFGGGDSSGGFDAFGGSRDDLSSSGFRQNEGSGGFPAFGGNDSSGGFDAFGGTRDDLSSSGAGRNEGADSLVAFGGNDSSGGFDAFGGSRDDLSSSGFRRNEGSGAFDAFGGTRDDLSTPAAADLPAEPPATTAGGFFGGVRREPGASGLSARGSQSAAPEGSGGFDAFGRPVENKSFGPRPAAPAPEPAPEPVAPPESPAIPSFDPYAGPTTGLGSTGDFPSFPRPAAAAAAQPRPDDPRRAVPRAATPSWQTIDPFAGQDGSDTGPIPRVLADDRHLTPRGESPSWQTSSFGNRPVAPVPPAAAPDPQPAYPVAPQMQTFDPVAAPAAPAATPFDPYDTPQPAEVPPSRLPSFNPMPKFYGGGNPAPAAQAGAQTSYRIRLRMADGSSFDGPEIITKPDEPIGATAAGGRTDRVRRTAAPAVVKTTAGQKAGHVLAVLLLSAIGIVPLALLMISSIHSREHQLAATISVPTKMNVIDATSGACLAGMVLALLAVTLLYRRRLANRRG